MTTKRRRRPSREQIVRKRCETDWFVRHRPVNPPSRAETMTRFAHFLFRLVRASRRYWPVCSVRKMRTLSNRTGEPQQLSKAIFPSDEVADDVGWASVLRIAGFKASTNVRVAECPSSTTRKR
jgi:hypothetical protein